MEQAYALIAGGIVKNIIVAPSLSVAVEVSPGFEVVESTGSVAYIGGAYLDGAFVPRPADPVPA